MPTTVNEQAPRRSTRGQKGVNNHSLVAFESEQANTTPARGRSTRGSAIRGGRAPKRGGRRTTASTPPRPPPIAPRKRPPPTSPASSEPGPPNPFVRPSKRPVGVEEQLALARSRLAYFEALHAGRVLPEGSEEEEEEDEQDTITELPRNQRRGSTVGPPRTHSYNGQPLSQQGLRREQAKKDLQRELRERARYTPETPEAEEFQEEEEIDFRADRSVDIDYITNPILKVWVNKANILNDSRVGDLRRRDLAKEGLDWIEGRVNAAIEEKTGIEEFTLQKEVVVRSLAGRAQNVHQTFENFDDVTLEWLLKIADTQYFNFPRHTIRITFYIRVDCPSLTTFAKPREKKPPPTSSPALSTLPILATPEGVRNDRSSQLRQANAIQRLAGYARRGDAVTQLHEQWRCIQEGCPNSRNFCYWNAGEKPGLHFKLDQPDMDSWASAIERDETSKWEPTAEGKHRIYAKGPIQRGNLAPNKPSAAQRMREQLEEQQEEMNRLRIQMQSDMMAERMEVMRERMEQRAEEKQEREMERLDRERAQTEARQLSRRQVVHPGRSEYPPTIGQNQTIRHEVSAPPLSYPPAAPAAPIQSDTHPSSPVDPTEDDFDLVEQFFAWLIDQQKTLTRQSSFKEVREVAIANYWTVNDLKEMGSPRSHLYKLATETHHLPDGIVRSLRRYLTLFKPAFRQRKVAGALLDLQVGLGGFSRADF